MDTEFTLTQKRALAVCTVVAIAFGAYFLRGYFILVVVAAVAAYLFTPLFNWLNKRLSTGLSAMITLLAVVASVIIPIGLLILLATVQITHMIRSVAAWMSHTDLSTLGERALQFVNEMLARLPFAHVTVTTEMLQSRMTTVAQKAGEWGLHVLQSAAGSIVGAVTAAIIFLYVFISMLVNRDKLQLLIQRLNPLGEEVTDLYLGKIGAMVRGTVRGQFIIALCQGVAGAASIYIAGFHDGFFIFAILLTALSVIPLGGGIITIPFGIGMALFGNVPGGLFVVLFHLIVVTNIDNFLRPILVPREARLDPALMLLAVFSGIAMFGFWGIVIGPVVMIVIVTTISVYLAVYKGVPMQPPEDDDPKSRRSRRLLARLRRSRQPTASEETTAP
jgi:predicted PurR-regulated permease PerM